MKDNIDFEAAKAHSLDNELEILSSKECGCFFCRSHFAAKEIVDWDFSNGHTQAICPECGMASVIGDASGYPIDHEFLKEMNLAFYGPDYISSHPEAARVYLGRYFEGKVNHNAKNEKLALTYLKALVAIEDSRAAFTLASIYEFGGDFARPSIAEAAAVYSLPWLASHPRAQARLGGLYLNGFNGPLTKWEAFECIMKSAVTGDFEGIYLLATCYFTGYFVKADPSFAYQLLFDSFPDVYYAFLAHPDQGADFIDYSYRIANCLLSGVGTDPDDDRALRYLLFAMLGISIREKDQAYPERGPLENGVYDKLGELSAQHGLQRGEMVFDQDTFYDSFSEGIQWEEKKHLVDFRLDPESHILELTIDFYGPTILTDEGSLDCRIVNGRTKWRFNNVARVEGTADHDFTTVMSPSDGIWAFGNSQEENPVAFIFFDEPESEDQ